MRYEVIIEIPDGTVLGRWRNARKEFTANSIESAGLKAEKELLKLGLHKDGDYLILDIRRAI